MPIGRLRALDNEGAPMRRLSRLAILLTLVVPLSVVMLVSPSGAQGPPGPQGPSGTPGPHGPHGFKPVKIACTTLSGNAASSSNPPTISGCNHQNVTGGAGTFPAGSIGASPAGNTTVSWQSGGATTIQYASTVPQAQGDKCGPDPTSPGNQQTEVILHGSVQPPGNGGVKGAVHAKICLTSTGDMSLLSGPFKL